MTAPPTQPTPLDLDALELAAKAALVDRPAPWSAHEDRYRHRCLVDANQVTIVEQEAGDVDPDVLAHLVAANPATVLALVAEVRALRAERDKWKADYTHDMSIMDKRVGRARDELASAKQQLADEQAEIGRLRAGLSRALDIAETWYEDQRTRGQPLESPELAALRALVKPAWTCASCGRTFRGSPGDPGTSRDAVRCPVRSGSVQCVPCDPHP
jgi:hypothetical protein